MSKFVYTPRTEADWEDRRSQTGPDGEWRIYQGGKPTSEFPPPKADRSKW
jgi:hypothetical protein